MRADDLTAKSKKDLLELARKLDIPGRSAMSKEDLARAIARKRQASVRPKPAESEAGPVPKGARRAGKREPSARETETRATEPEIQSSATPEARPTPSTSPADAFARRPLPSETERPNRGDEGTRSDSPPRESQTRNGQQPWLPQRPPRDSHYGARRGMPPIDPAMKLSRVEEIRKSAPGRAGRPGGGGSEGEPRRMHGRIQGGGRPRDDRRHGDRFQQKGGPVRGDRRDMRHGRDRRMDPHSVERSLQAREHLRRSGEARRHGGYVPRDQRSRESRPPLEPPRPASIPEHLVRVVAPSVGQQRPDLEERTGHPVEVPGAYGKDRIALMVRDPHWLHAYWEVTPETIDRLRDRIGELWDNHKWLLRVQMHTEDGSRPPGGHFDIELNPVARNWYFQVPQPDCSYDALIGILTRDGTFHPLARSNKVRTPRATMSGVLDEEWASTDEEFKQIYSLSGGHAAGGASASSAELGESLLDRQKEGWFSGMLGSMGSGAYGAQKQRGFWFQVNTELIVYGATEPDARLTVQGRPIQLRPDGTFTLRFQLPDGAQEIPCVATSADGLSERTITPIVRRQTTSAEREPSSAQGPEA